MHRTRFVLTAAAVLGSAAIESHSLPGQSSTGRPITAPANSATTTKKAAAPNCTKVDTTAAWYKKQLATLDESGMKWSNDSLRQALLSAAGLNVATALVPQLGWQNASAPVVETPAESAMVVVLKRAGGRGGGGGRRGGAAPGAGGAAGASPAVGAGAPALPWPVKSVVGAAGVRATFVIIQLDSAIQEAGMHHLMEPGPDEDIAADIAYLNDRERILVGRKQPFGTQLHLVNGKLVPLPIEDSAHVDLRRDDAGLPPLAWSVCNANIKK